MNSNSELKLECMAIGSLPHENLEDAMALVRECFTKVPFWPQLVKLNKNEDMIVQFLEKMPSFFHDNDKCYLETESDRFFEDVEQFFIDYEEIILDIHSKSLDRYAVSKNNSYAFPSFLKIVKELKPKFAKGQIVGPFTLATTLVDKYGKCAIYDETLREIIVKTLTLKALWQINQIKTANISTIPVIFIDEPSISQLGTSAFVGISSDVVMQLLKDICDAIKNNGALAAIHCCGKCDWRLPIDAGVNIINLDAYDFAQSLSIYVDDLVPYLENGGKIAWGLVPTLNPEILENINLDELILLFEKAVKYLTNKGIDEKLIIDNSIITPSCGAGALTVSLAKRAMMLTRDLSESLKERY